MGWPFCPSCRASLLVNGAGEVSCGVCPYRSHLTERKGDIPTRRTFCTDRPIPLWAKSDQEQAALKQSTEPVRATIEEPCIKCGHPEVGYYTVQLRSVDEGQTVFYECPQCKHTWSINN
jgi:DNA-directed RNA polymerase I subunit RPA12